MKDKVYMVILDTVDRFNRLGTRGSPILFPYLT